MSNCPNEQIIEIRKGVFNKITAVLEEIGLGGAELKLFQSIWAPG
jgi:hypothetical protein